MSCTRQIEAWQPLEGGPLLFRFPLGARQGEYERMLIDCRKCPGCQEKQARSWAIRCVHESKMHKAKSFITCTYADEHLPRHGSLSKRHAQLFMKRLRRALEPKQIRFFLVGEYGSRTARAHLHALIFGEDFSADRKAAGKSRSGYAQYESEVLTRAWGMGRCTLQELTVETAMYACRYALKSAELMADGKRGLQWWQHPNGQWLQREREFKLASKGLGRSWFEEFHRDIGVYDSVVLPGGQKLPVPRYYDQLLREWCEDDYLDLKDLRRERMLTLQQIGELHPSRLYAREEVQRAKHALSKRDVL